MKRRCIIGVIVGLVLCAIGVCCAIILGSKNSYLVYLGIVFTIAGAFVGRRSLRGLICIAIFNSRKSKELAKLEELYSCGGISQEDYYSQKIALLNAEYGDR